MPPTFLPALRSKGRPPAITGQVLPAASASPATLAPESKVVLRDYYQSLLNAGVRLGDDGRGRPWTLDRAIADGYERGVWTFKAVEAIAGSSSRLPFRLREGEKTVEDHPLYRVLNHGKANPLETGRQFRKRLSAQVLLSAKGAFVETTESRAGDVVRLDLLPPSRTRVVPGDGANLVKHYELLDRQGRLEREIDPAKVRWVREPHPTDPYMGVTPLQAAGGSVELDHFARWFNVSFLRNDGRPGGVLAVAGEMEEDEMDRVESRFGKGPSEAGKLSVIAGQVSYVDLAARSRDVQYAQLSRNAKVEILVAFGVPESQLGNAADRTFANADEEAEAFWTITMAAHNDLIVSAFADDSEDTYEGFLDVSGVEALQRAVIARRAELREELAAGAISIDEYREKAGHDPIDLPHTRALYIASGKTPIPTREEDAEALGLAVAVDDAPAEPAAPEEDPGMGDDQQGGGGTPPAPPTPPAAGPGGARTAADVVAAARGAQPQTKALRVVGGAPPLLTPAVAERKEAGLRLVVSRKAAPQPAAVEAESLLDEALVEDVETALREALEGLAVAWTERAIAKIESPKSRKGTRHWQPEYDVDTRMGTKALDPTKAVDPERWATEADEALRPLLIEGGEVAAEDLAEDLGWQEAVAAAVAAWLAARGFGDDAEQDDDLRLAPDLRRLATVVAVDVAALVKNSARRQAGALIDLLVGRDTAGASMDEIKDEARGWGVRAAAGWAAGLAAHAAGAVMEAARAALADAVTGLDDEAERDVQRTWVSKRDERVRTSHDDTDGQKRPLDEPFAVGESLLRFPGDPLAPIHETAGCRCRLVYTSRTTGRFVARPTGRKHLPGKHDQGSHGNRFRRTGPKKRDRERIREGRARATREEVGEAPSARDGRGKRVREDDVAKISSEDERDYKALLAEIAQDWKQPEEEVTPEDLADYRRDWEDEYVVDPEVLADLDRYAMEDEQFMAGWAAEWAERPWGIADDDKDAQEDAYDAWAGQERRTAPLAGGDGGGDGTGGVPQSILDENRRHEEERLAGGGRARRPKRIDDQVREDYDLYIEAQMLAASEATRGALYSRAGIDRLKKEGTRNQIGGKFGDRDLFTGRLPAKYVSEELLAWFADNGRMTYTQFRAQALGRDSDRRRTAGRPQTFGEFGSYSG